MATDLFVYGTLRAPALMQAVAGPGAITPVPAGLNGSALRPVAGDVVPMIVPAPGKAVQGTLWRGLNDAQMARLDLYEGAFGYRLADVGVTLPDGTTAPAQVYLPPDGLEPGAGGWSLDDWQQVHLDPALLAATELFAHDPLPAPGDLRRMWPVMEKRAWARHRARTAPPGPARVRHAARPGDLTITDESPPRGTFFRLQDFKVSHRRFDDRAPQVQPREVFLGIDAALVLPYDARRDRVLLVEQARMGAAMRHDPNPWTLEPIAGMVDARETPQACALREAEEEAGLTGITLDHIASFYPSPGSSTDYFHCFIGLCDLAQSNRYTGGLESEGEDLRLHPLSFAAAMDLAASGEITAGPLLAMLYWLALHRDRLRATVA